MRAAATAAAAAGAARPARAARERRERAAELRLPPTGTEAGIGTGGAARGRGGGRLTAVMTTAMTATVAAAAVARVQGKFSMLECQFSTRTPWKNCCGCFVVRFLGVSRKGGDEQNRSVPR